MGLNKNIFSIIFTTFVSLISFVGCGGGNETTPAPNSNQPEAYKELLTSYSPAIQVALNLQPIQHVHVDTYQGIENILQSNQPVTFVIDFNLSEVDTSEYYLYGTVKVEDKVIAESFIILDNDGQVTNASVVTRALGHSNHKVLNELKKLGVATEATSLAPEKPDIKKMVFTLKKDETKVFKLSNPYINDRPAESKNKIEFGTTSDLVELIEISISNLLF